MLSIVHQASSANVTAKRPQAASTRLNRASALQDSSTRLGLQGIPARPCLALQTHCQTPTELPLIMSCSHMGMDMLLEQILSLFCPTA